MYENYINLNRTAYMKENNFELSREKTCLILFNNGENPKSAYLKYNQMVSY